MIIEAALIGLKISMVYFYPIAIKAILPPQ
jgi:hypothetical protein